MILFLSGVIVGIVITSMVTVGWSIFFWIKAKKVKNV